MYVYIMYVCSYILMCVRCIDLWCVTIVSVCILFMYLRPSALVSV